jgi:hypothetical protein
MLMRSAAVLVVFSVPLSFQTSAQGGDPPRRALVVINTTDSNTAYSKLPRPPVDDSGAKAVADALRDAHFDVTVRENLDLNSLIEVLDQFRLKVHSGDVCFFYYSGYTVHELDTNYLVPVDYDPDSNGEIYNRAYSIARWERGVAKNSPFLSMLVLDASWDTPKLAGQAGLTETTPPAHTWEFASTGPNQITAETSGKMGLFTKALIETLPQHGLDLTDLVSKVTSNVGTASKGTQHPHTWSSDPPKFFFHEPDPLGEMINRKDRLQYVQIPAGTFWMGCAPASEAQCNPSEKPRHRVEITKSFWLGQTEVTNLAYNERYARLNKLPPKKPKGITNAGKQTDLPVVGVSWEEAQKYCNWGAGGR